MAAYRLVNLVDIGAVESRQVTLRLRVSYAFTKLREHRYSLKANFDKDSMLSAYVKTFTDRM